MKARAALYAGLILAVGALAIGCGGGAVRPVPLDGRQAALAVAADEAEPLDAAVARSQALVAGSVPYGIINGPWQTPPPAKRAGFNLLEDEEVVPPPDESTAGPRAVVPGTQPESEAAAAPGCASFSGNKPPTCTDTGEFQRAFSGPNYSYALARITLPANIPGMSNLLGSNGDAGFVYFEGWPLAAKSLPSEFGFQYSSVHNWYTPYYRTSSPVDYRYATFALNNYVHYTPSQTVTLALAGYLIGPVPYLHVALLGNTGGPCTVVGGTAQTHNCLTHGHFQDANWTPSRCCIFGRMTTIAQKGKLDTFYDGAVFGPIAWSGAELAATPPAPAPGSTLLPIAGNQPAWVSAGEQSYPNAQNKVIAQNMTATGETDTINLTRLPPLNLTITPSADQTVKPGSTIKYSVKATNTAGAPPLLYGWLLGNPLHQPGNTLVVPGATSGNGTIGPGTSATLTIGPNQGPYALSVQCLIYFVDAAGKLIELSAAPWDQNGGFPQATDSIHVGLK